MNPTNDPLESNTIDAALQGPNRLAQAAQVIAAWLSLTAPRQGELAQCDPRDVEAIARDVGLSTAELAAAVKGSNGSTAELTRLLTALSLDPAALAAKEPATMRDLSRICAGCGDKQRCNHDLDAGVSAATYRDYCPNDYTVSALVAERQRT